MIKSSNFEHKKSIREDVVDANCRHHPALSITESPDVGPSVVVHTTVSFGTQHLEWDKEKVQQLIINELKAMMPHLPEPASIKCQKWRYSQVITGYISKFVLDQKLD